MSRVPFRLQQLDHVVLRVQDIERAIHFYTTVLGCSVERRRHELGLVHLRAGSSLIDLVALSGPLGLAGGAAPGAEGRNMDHLCLRIEPFDEAAIRAHLQALGMAAPGPLQNNFGAEGTGPSLYLADPDGNAVELKGPA